MFFPLCIDVRFRRNQAKQTLTRLRQVEEMLCIILTLWTQNLDSSLNLMNAGLMRFSIGVAYASDVGIALGRT